MVAASPSKIFVKLGLASIKRATSWLRAADAVHPDWTVRAEICGRCPLCVTEKKRSYCGRPFLRQLDRHEPTEGCGCPVNLKAQDPAEHCPRNAAWDASSKTDAATCDCTWCVALRLETTSS